MRYIAFLRGVNVGGARVLKMERLRQALGSLGLSNVETFIASGNVIFESPETDTAALEQKIEEHLEGELGYDVDTYLRTAEELAGVAAQEPFPAAAGEGGSSVYVLFVKEPLATGAGRRLAALNTEADEFAGCGREVYWLCRTRISDSHVTPAALTKGVGSVFTSRNMTTVRRLAAKYPPERT